MPVNKNLCPAICLVEKAQIKNSPNSTTCVNISGEWDMIQVDRQVSIPPVSSLVIDGSQIVSVVFRQSKGANMELHLSGTVYAPVKSWELVAEPLADTNSQKGYRIFHKTEYEICSQFRTQDLILEIRLPANIRLEHLSITAKEVRSEIPLVCAKQLAMTVIQNVNATVQCPRLRICSEVGQVNASLLSPGNTHAMISSIQGDISLILRGYSEVAAAIHAPIQRQNWIVSRKEKEGRGELTGRIYTNTGAITIR